MESPFTRLLKSETEAEFLQWVDDNPQNKYFTCTTSDCPVAIFARDVLKQTMHVHYEDDDLGDIPLDQHSDVPEHNWVYSVVQFVDDYFPNMEVSGEAMSIALRETYPVYKTWKDFHQNYEELAIENH